MKTRLLSLVLLCGVSLLWSFGVSGIVGGCGGGAATVTVLANAGDDQDVLVGETASLDGQGSVGVNNAVWTFTSQPTGSSATLTNANTLTPSFTPDVEGDYVAQLSVNGGDATDSVTVTAKTVLAAVTVPEGSAVTTRTRFNSTEFVIDLEQTGGILSGETSRTAALGVGALKAQAADVTTYQWEQISGPAATATNGTTNATLEFTAPSFADFFNDSDHYKWQILPVSREDTKMVFKLTVTDADGNSDSAVFTVYVQDDGLEIHTSSGLPNVGVGTTVILSGPDLDASGASATVAANENGDPVTDWSWTLAPPSGSSATFLDTGTTSSALQFPKFIPDVAGLYVVSFNSATGNTGATAIPTVKVPGSLSINAAEYAGVGTIGGTSPRNPQCATCHDGSPLSGLTDVVSEWSGTVHATKFENSMATYAGLAPEPFLWEFHTVGYDIDAANDGFDDLASENDFTFPEEGLSFSDFASTFPEVAKLANIQCENCHGPGSQHAGDPLRISHSASQFGTCGQCHIQEDEWKNSHHNMTGVVHGSGAYQGFWVTNAGCVRCHNAKGFEAYLDEGEEGLGDMSGEAGAFPGATCAACHDPHDAANDHQLRLAGNVTMIIDNSTVDAGKAAVCYTCHDGNYAHDEVDCDTNADGRADAVCATKDATAIGYWRGGYHYNPQAPILEGKQALADLNGDGTDDFAPTENSFHSSASFTLAGVTGDSSLPSENNKCVTCHMAAGPSSEEEGYRHLGGHSFKLRTGHSLSHLRVQTEEGAEEETTEAEAGDLELVSACTVCHASVTEINREARADYDGDGNREGIQDEVAGLLLNLSNKIKSLDTDDINQTSGTTESGGTITVNAISWAGTRTSGLTATANCATGSPSGGRDAYQPCNFLDAGAILRRAVWNYNSVVRDGSLGVHNAAYTIQVLQGTYKALGILLEGDAATTTYKTDFPNATLR
jgi:hypothetical protein